MLVRIKFEKLGALRFIGHLDLMRTFQKLFRRADIPIAYSEGFNPHQIFSIAAPISVGVASLGEYLDLKLKVDMDIEQLILQMNQAAPLGLKTVDAMILEDQVPAAMAAVTGAKYRIEGDFTGFDLDAFLIQETIIIRKKNKKGKFNDLDLKPGIFQLRLEGLDLLMTLATGSQFNIKPEAVLTELCNFSGATFQRYAYYIERIDLLQDLEKGLNLIGKAVD